MNHADARRRPPKIYWIRVAVDAEIFRPDQYVGALLDRIRDGIHTQHATAMSESTLLSLIEGAIRAEVAEAEDAEDAEDTDHGARATCTDIVDSACRAADGAAHAEREAAR